MIRSILLTGGSGLLGAEVIKSLPDDATVYSIGRKACDRQIEKRPNLQLLECDLARPLDTEAFPKNVDAVVHLAQSEHYRDFPNNAQHVFSVNTAATLSLLNYARDAGARTFIYASAGKPFGTDAGKFLNGAPDPTRKDVSFYLTTKLCSELIANSYAQFMTTVVLRFFFIYGPRQHDRMLIPRLIRSVVHGDPITIAGDNGITISPTYVSDAAQAVVRALNLGESAKFDIGGPERITLRNLAEMIGDMTATKPIFSMQHELPIEEVCAETEPMIEYLGAPTVAISEGLREVLATGRWS